MQIHATCCARDAAGGPVGVLLLGPPGSGKSDLALRLIDAGFALVADDRVDVAIGDDGAFASAPAALAGLIEVRGIGIVRLGSFVPRARIALAVTLAPRSAQERLPEPARTALAGHVVPTIAVDPDAPSAVARVRLALDVLEGHAASRCGALGDSMAAAT
jgi:serine kinase of HPr protein (carbohydrate metabolism regulator)